MSRNREEGSDLCGNLVLWFACLVACLTFPCESLGSRKAAVGGRLLRPPSTAVRKEAYFGLTLLVASFALEQRLANNGDVFPVSRFCLIITSTRMIGLNPRDDGFSFRYSIS